MRADEEAIAAFSAEAALWAEAMAEALGPSRRQVMLVESRVPEERRVTRAEEGLDL